jgi:hypothetical protein
MEYQETTEARLEYEEPASGDIKEDRNETTACNEATEKIELDPGMMRSAEEHHDVPSEDVVRAVKGLKKRHRGRKLTAGRRGEPKELTRGNCGSWRKLAAARRKVSRHATVARCKRNVFRKIWTEVNCGPRSTLAAANKRMDRCAGVTQRGGQDGTRTMWDKKSRNDERTGRDCGNILSATGD